jgi:hypothetical protein
MSPPMTGGASPTPVLTMNNLNPRVIEVEYAVRGPIVIRAAEIERQLKQVVTHGLWIIHSLIELTSISI